MSDEEVSNVVDALTSQGYGLPMAGRAIEKQLLECVCADGEQKVVALGGGALLDRVCRKVAEANGRVIVFDCEIN